MRIFVFKPKDGLRYGILLALAIAVICIAGIAAPKVAEVFSTNRELPIYSVERPEKVVSITFDCAWVAVS